MISPDNRFALVNDLGTDRIMVYKLNASTAELTPNDPPFYTAAPGSGPRHLAFHPNDKWAYTINELDSTITCLSWNAQTGVLTTVDNISTLPPVPTSPKIVLERSSSARPDAFSTPATAVPRGVAGLCHCTHWPPDACGAYPLGGKEACHFALAPAGNFLVVAEQFTNQVSVFTRDRSTGLLFLRETNIQ